MIHVTEGFHKLKFNEVRYKIDFESACKQVALEAAKEWLLAILNSAYPTKADDGAAGFPQWTGMAKASFIPFARALSQMGLNVDVTISPNPRASKMSATEKAAKNPELGELAGKMKWSNPIGIYYNQWGAYRFELQFNSDVLHYLVNEYTGGHVKSAPWHSLEKGREAFQTYIGANLVGRVPGMLSSPKYITFEDKGG